MVKCDIISFYFCGLVFILEVCYPLNPLPWQAFPQGLNNRWNWWQSISINRLISIINEQSMLKFFVIIDFIDYHFLSIINANRSVNWHQLSSTMIKMVDRPNTTPVGQGGASQWCNVLFDPHLFEARSRNFVFLWQPFRQISKHSMDNLLCGAISIWTHIFWKRIFLFCFMLFDFIWVLVTRLLPFVTSVCLPFSVRSLDLLVPALLSLVFEGHLML